MSTLTKISVVILAVLTLFAAFVFITLASVTANYRHAYESQVLKNKTLEQQVNTANAALQLATRERENDKRTLSEFKTTKQRDDETHAQEAAAWRVDKANLQTQIENLKLEIGKLNSTNGKNAELIEKLNGLLLAEKENSDKLNKDLIRMTNLQNQVTARAESMEKVAKVLREQLADRDEKIRDLQQKLSTPGGPKAAQAAAAQEAAAVLAATTANADISGTVTAVKDDMASINVGAAKGVKEGMQLIVYRGSQFVAYLRVQQVDIDSAAGIITDRQAEPAQGDKVASKLK